MNELDFVLSCLRREYKDNLQAVYMRGSHLNNLDTEDSDLDLLVVVKPQLTNLLGGAPMSKDKKGPEGTNSEYKLVDEYALLAQLRKGNTTTLECFVSKPLYTSPSFERMANLLHKRQTELLFVNPKGTLNSDLGLLRQSVFKAKKLSLEEDTPVLLKTMVASRKSYGRLMSLLELYKNLSFDELLVDSNEYQEYMRYTVLKGDLRSELLELKTKSSLSKDEEEALREELLTREGQLAGLQDSVDLLRDTLPSEELMKELMRSASKPVVE